MKRITTIMENEAFQYVMNGEKPSDFVSRKVVKIKENIGEEVCW